MGDALTFVKRLRLPVHPVLQACLTSMVTKSGSDLRMPQSNATTDKMWLWERL